MELDLQSVVLNALSERLSISLSELVRISGKSQDEVKEAVRRLEVETLVRTFPDSVTGDQLIAPTSRGLLRARQNFKSAF